VSVLAKHRVVLGADLEELKKEETTGGLSSKVNFKLENKSRMIAGRKPHPLELRRLRGRNGRGIVGYGKKGVRKKTHWKRRLGWTGLCGPY